METKTKKNPFYQIFKLNASGSITEEIENPNNFHILFDYLKDNSNDIKRKIQLITKLTNTIKLKRSICAFFSKYDNKSIYIFLFDLFLNEKNSKELKDSIINLIKELNSNIQITKEIYEYIFQKFSLAYRKDKKLLSNIGNSPVSFNNYYYDLLNLLFSIFDDTNENKNKDEPKNYYSCFGNNSFTVYFNKKDFIFGNFIALIMNFKISNSKILTENPEQLGNCTLININFNDMKKKINIELKYPFFVILKDGIKEYNAKVCPLNEWINLVICLELIDDNLKTYFFVNGENTMLPLSIKNMKIQKDDIINSISFFNNFYGEVSSISMLSMNQNDSLNIFSKSLKYFLEIKNGLWKRKYLINFINYLQSITYGDKKNEPTNVKNLYNNLVFIFTPFNYNINRPNIIEDCLEKYNMIINGNICNHRYQNYQKKINQICNVNNFLPIAEMALIYQQELLKEKNFLLYLKIISKIVSSKENIFFMKESNFFELLSLFIEKIPNQFLNENIINEFYNIAKIIIKQNIKNFSSDYFTSILLNEKIIFKFSKELQIKFWNKILELCLSDKDQIESFISMKKICIILRYYDRDRYNEMCCQYHLKMYKKEFIGNMKAMEPNLNQRLIHIQKILDVAILIQNPENIIPLFRLLLLDISPCFKKFILKIFITSLDYTNKNQEWKNKLVLAIINAKYDVIIVNSFIHSLPDIRYEILILMNSIFSILFKLNKTNEFISFEKKIKTCLLPQKIFYMQKKDNKKNNLSKDSIKDKSKIVNNIFALEYIDYSSILKEYEIDSQDMRSTKSNSINNLPSKNVSKQINNETEGKIGKKNTIGEKTKFIKEHLEAKMKSKNNENINKEITSKKTDNKFVENNQSNLLNNFNNNKITPNNNNLSETSHMAMAKRKDGILEYFDLKEGSSIFNNNENENLIFRDELFDIYINSLYILFLKWILGVPITYTSSTSFELFSSLKQQKDIPINSYCITHIKIVELFFALENELNNINFTIRCLNFFSNLIKIPENSYIILSNQKIYSSLLDITFKYYNKCDNNSSEIVKEMFKVGKNILVYIFINSLSYLKNKKGKYPMERLETIFLWGEKNIVGDINDNQKVNKILDFIYEILLDLLSQIKNVFMHCINFEFKDKNDNPVINFYFRNFLIHMTFIYNFCFHYKVDPIIKNSDIESFSTVSLNINIPEIFISGMRMDNSKGNNICEYWKDYKLLEDILNRLNYIFKEDFIVNKMKGEGILKSKASSDKKNLNKKEIKYEQYLEIIKELVSNKDKKDLFKNELLFLCYYEESENQIETMIPLLRILSITLICILTIVKDSNNEEQFKYYINQYKNLLVFTILSSINISKNISSDPMIYTKIQKICFDVISSGLCFMNNLYECSTICNDKIGKSINNIFLLCFSILKYYNDIKNNKIRKIFNLKSEIEDLSSNAVIVLFNDYIKDKDNKIPLLDNTILEKIFLNSSSNIVDLINKNPFYELFFENKNLKNQLFKNYYSLSSYKLLVDKRYNLIRTLDDKLDYSYQINIIELLPLYENELLKYSNNSNENKKRRKDMYKKQKKRIFSFNGMWSNREIFYGDICSQKIKYKVINHYTKNLMKPLISPIIDINYYLPEFTDYNKDTLFRHDNKNKEIKSNNNDFILDIDNLLKMPNDQKDLVNNKKTTINNNNEENLKTLLKNEDESKKIILNQIYHKSNSKFCEFLIKLSNILDFGKDEELEIDMMGEKNQLINDKENEDNDSIDDNKDKENIRKDTAKTELTSCSTIKTENNINLAVDKEKNEEILNNKDYFICCLVKPSHHTKGVIFIKDDKLNFNIFSDQKKGCNFNGILQFFNEKDDDYDKEHGTCFGSYFIHHPKDKNSFKISIKYNEIKWILKRKYYYKNSGIEIFTIKNKAFYFNFKDEESQFLIFNELIKKLGDCLLIINDIKELPNSSSEKTNTSTTNNNNIIGVQNNFNPFLEKICKIKFKKNIKLSNIITQWKNWEITNFELLILLNLFSNRSYNDLTQYPVFPWVLENYTDPLKTEKKQGDEDENEGEKKDINIIEDYTYRDLSLPMGMMAINEYSSKRRKNFLSSYKIRKEDESMKPYIYGCNYSNPTYVCNYLIRLFPFTQICIELQGKGFDTPRRLFVSIEKAFKNATTQSSDVRELIPEFFYLPEMFLNINNLNMGNIDEKNLVDDVATPCRNNPYEFISVMRIALESENVSYNINNWIDLIFGYKARGEEADIAKNVFTEQSYQEEINLYEVEDKESLLRYGEFGLIPNQLFNTKEFPDKEKIDNVKKYKEIMEYSFKIRKYKCKVSNNNIKQGDDLLLLTAINFSQDKLYFFYNTNLIIEEKISNSIFDKEYSEEIIDFRQLKPTLNKMSDYYFLPYMNTNKNIKIIKEGNIIIMGGYYDGKLIVIMKEIENKTLVQNEITPFKDESPITTLNVDKDEEYLFVGNSFGNVCVIQITGNNIKEWKILFLINDQLNSISHIDSNSELNVWASASIDGYINIYTLPNCKLTNSFKVPINNTVNYIFICDCPLPSIIIIFQEDIYLYSINGFKIFYQKEYSNINNPIVIKDFIRNDYLAYVINNKEIIIRNIPDFSIQTRIEDDTEIYYLCPSIDMKILYALNKSGTQIDAFMIDTKKTIEENQ